MQGQLKESRSMNRALEAKLKVRREHSTKMLKIFRASRHICQALKNCAA